MQPNRKNHYMSYTKQSKTSTFAGAQQKKPRLR